MSLTTQETNRNLRAMEAARYLGVSVSMLNKLRMKRLRHEGPTFAKICGCVIYRKADLDEWLLRNIVTAG